ncbi:MAG: bleomycin resistance protein [Mucilaginibacter sp.]|nr:bleomycin resistance protein [Mucilaginibacter sp.]
MRKLKNAISWFEIPVTDVPRARRFYETILALQMTEIELDADFIIVLFPVEDGTVAGALCKHQGFYTPGQTGNVLYLNAGPDLQEVLDKVVPAGGKILKAKNHISDNFGFTAYIEDTEGNRVGLHSLT